MQHGITRICITDVINGQGAYRFRQAKVRQPAANKLYRAIFHRLGMPLADGEHELKVTKNEFEAGYDHLLGIDVIFTFRNGMECTMQEKFLTAKYQTVTVEHMQNPSTGEKGDWFTMKCDYYFVGYDREQKYDFQEWIMLNWPIVRQLTNQNKINWQLNKNKEDGARADFKYASFCQFPKECIVHAKWTPANNMRSAA